MTPIIGGGATEDGGALLPDAHCRPSLGQVRIEKGVRGLSGSSFFMPHLIALLLLIR